ncbi:MAG TPA: hypothetical protein VFY53_01935 [Rhodoplanes sp.]|nr:hypothetical protein [Rhodoplanes sp.]
MSTRSWTTSSDTALKLRQLRRLAQETKNHDLERNLYIEERKAERGILLAQYWRDGWRGILSARMLGHCLWIAVMASYSLFADCGRSFVRPLVGLAISVIFHWAYGSVLTAPSDRSRLEDFRRAAWAFSISNAVPFVGALTLERDVKLTLLCGDRPTSVQPASGTPAAQTAQPAQPQSLSQCVPVPGRRFQLLALGQSIFSVLCLFFIALALRNYFKLK